MDAYLHCMWVPSMDSSPKYFVAIPDRKGDWKFALYHDDLPPWWRRRRYEEPDALMIKIEPAHHDLSLDVLIAIYRPRLAVGISVPTFFS